MNWGTRIAIGLSTFIVFIVASCIYMISKDSDSLLEDNYYERGLTYDDTYQRKTNVNNEHAQPLITVTEDSIRIEFASNKNEGVLKLIRPSNNKSDKKVSFKTTDHRYGITTKELEKGNWIGELAWTSHGIAFEYQQVLIIK